MTRHLIPRRIIAGHVAHKPHDKPYAYGCTEAAIRRYAAHGFDGVDLDLTVNADGTPMVNHWGYPIKRDAWFDPTKSISPETRISDLTDEQCDLLRYKDEDGVLHPMLSARDAMVICKTVGIIPCFEAKYDPRGLFYKIDFWKKFKTDADSIGIVPVIMSLPGSTKMRSGQRKLAAAHVAGLVTMWLWRSGHPTPPANIDLVKSHSGRPIYLTHQSDLPTPPVVIPPKPEPPRPRKYDPKRWRELGSPVKHPFMPRTRRWKRRHPKLWRSILSFRRKWRNR